MDKTIFGAYLLAALAVGASIFFTRRVSAETVEKDLPPMEPKSPQQPLPIVAAQPTPRGIRNNNPGNIEYIAINPYRGQTGSDGRYGIYATPVDGIRALLLEVWDSIERDGDDTIRKLVAQWAPPNENDTAAYADSVSKQTGIPVDARLSYRSHAIAVGKAITRHENGINPYTPQQFIDAYAAAGKHV